jgi:ribosomal protein S18 acetylase RimI-like enzyme
MQGRCSVPTHNYSLRPQHSTDHAFIQHLYASTRATEMSGCGWPAAAIAEFLRQQFQRQLHHYQEHFPDGEFWLIEQQGRAIGRLYLFWGEHTLQLIDIALLPEQRGAGLGTALLGDVLTRADDRGLAVGLHVEAHNQALRLYQRLGFSVIGDRGIYLEMRRPARRQSTTPLAESHQTA